MKKSRKYIDRVCPYCKDQVDEKDNEAAFVDQFKNSRRQYFHKNCFLKEVKRNGKV